MRQVSIALWAFILLLCPLRLFAQVDLSAEVAPNPATIEDELRLTVVVQGSLTATEPVLPSMPAFKVIAAGTSSSIQIINGDMSSRKEYSYILIPQEEGHFTIAPISVFAKGQEYKSKPIEVTVGASQNIPTPAAPGVPGPGAPGQPSPPVAAEPLDPQTEASGPYWIETKVSNNEPYVNEQILFTFRFFTKVQVGDANLTLPEFKEFWTEEVVPEKKYYQTIRNERYVVSEKVIALYPLQSGDTTIGTTLLRAEVPTGRASPDPFDNFFSSLGRFNRFSMRPKNLKAPAIALKVKPLPPGAPSNFTNLVGHFSMTAALNPAQAKVGESASLTLEISGSGNIKDATLPRLIDDSLFKVYEDKPTTDLLRKETGIEGKKTFKMAIVPTRPGDFSLPPMELSTFNPQTGLYETIRAPGLALKALPGDEQQVNAAGPAANDASPVQAPIVSEDLAPIRPAIRWNHSWMERNFDWIALAALIPPFVFFALWLVQKRKQRRLENAPAYRSKYALKNFKGRLSSARDLAGLLETVRDYVGDKSGIPGKSLTASEMRGRLAGLGIQGTALQDFQVWVESLEAANYGMMGGGRSIEQWSKEANEKVTRLDREANR